MQASTWFVLFIVALLMISSCIGKRMFQNNDNNNDMELTKANARFFLQNDADNDVDKRVNNADCVLCKFNTIPCCKPNICIKKRFRPDECMEIKGK
jgi:hypothetical protein